MSNTYIKLMLKIGNLFSQKNDFTHDGCGLKKKEEPEDSSFLIRETVFLLFDKFI